MCISAHVYIHNTIGTSKLLVKLLYTVLRVHVLLMHVSCDYLVQECWFCIQQFNAGLINFQKFFVRFLPDCTNNLCLNFIKLYSFYVEPTFLYGRIKKC